MKTAKMPLEDTRQRRTLHSPLLLVVLIIAIGAAIGIPLYLSYSQMVRGATPQTAQQFATSTPGAEATIDLQVTSVPSPALLTGNLLQKNADGTYSRSEETVRVHWATSSVVMGSSSGVTVGAIIQVSGVLGTNGVLTAQRIVILTGFVKLR